MQTINFIISEKTRLGVWKHDVYQVKLPADLMRVSLAETIELHAAGLAEATIQFGAEQVEIVQILGKHSLTGLRTIADASMPFATKLYSQSIGKRWTFSADDFKRKEVT